MDEMEFGQEAKGLGRLIAILAGVVFALVMAVAFAPMLLRNALMAMW